MPDLDKTDLETVTLRADWWRSRFHRLPSGYGLAELYEELAAALKRAELENTKVSFDAAGQAAARCSAGALAAPGAINVDPRESVALACFEFVQFECKRRREFAVD